MTITVDNLKDEMKISDYLRKYAGFSSSLITKVKFGGVFVNSEQVTMRRFVKNGDTVTVNFPDEKSENIPPINIPLDILYEDECILAVNKPKEMPTHPSRGNSLPTLANAVMAYYGGNFIFRAVNRLDRGTSGIVIIAKDPYSAAKLGRAMKDGRFTKKYTALVTGIPSPYEGRIDAPIERESPVSIKRVVRDDGKSAITDYKVLKTLGENSVCELTLKTGRTHQIRVHMSYIGHPLVGDFLYGTPSAEGYKLHSSTIKFPHPKSGDMLEISSYTDF